MEFERLTYGKVWTKAEDFPTYQSDEEQVRRDMQYHPDAVKDYINDTLLTALEGNGAAEKLGAVDAYGMTGSVQSVLNDHADELQQLRESIAEVAAGGVPSVVQSTTVAFSEDSWAVVNGEAVLTIPQSEHKRENENFGYNLYQRVGSTYKSGTWGTSSTRVTYSGGSITLTADEAYSGRIVFFGL